MFRRRGSRPCRSFGKFWLAAAFLVPLAAWGAVPLIPSSPTYSEPSQIVATLNFLINSINSNVNQQTMANFATPRNLLDNGGMQVQQRGTGTQTCGTTTVPATAYSADRWGCNVNVTSGAGILQVITTAANLPQAPLPTFNAAMVFYRNSGALAQPQCVMQEIPTKRVTPMAGQNVNLSVYIQGLAAMLAEQTVVNVYLFLGTGSDQGLGTFTASPAITPAWTTINSGQTAAFTITSAWARYSASFNIPLTLGASLPVTEAAVALCWTPTTGGTAGVTDGFRFTGVQLEQGSTPSVFEFRNFADELATAQVYYYQVNDNVANTVPITMCQATTTSAVVCVHQFPVPMRVAPAAVASASTAFGDTATAGAPTACTAFSVVASSTSTLTGKTTCTTGATTTAGGGSQLVGANTGANLNFSADF